MGGTVDKTNPVRYSISGFEAAVLLFHLLRAGEKGNLSANATMKDLADQLEHYRQPVKKEVLEAALYVCNMDTEQGAFWHPYNNSFEQFAKKVLPADFTFNRTYNLIERKVGT